MIVLLFSAHCSQRWQCNHAGKGSLVVYFEFVQQVGVGGGGGGGGVLGPDNTLDDVVMERGGERITQAYACNYGRGGGGENHWHVALLYIVVGGSSLRATHLN